MTLGEQVKALWYNRLPAISMLGIAGSTAYINHQTEFNGHLEKVQDMFSRPDLFVGLAASLAFYTVFISSVITCGTYHGYKEMQQMIDKKGIHYAEIYFAKCRGKYCTIRGFELAIKEYHKKNM